MGGGEWEEGRGRNFTVTNLRLLLSLHVRDVLPESSFLCFHRGEGEPGNKAMHTPLLPCYNVPKTWVLNTYIQS